MKLWLVRDSMPLFRRRSTSYLRTHCTYKYLTLRTLTAFNWNPLRTVYLYRTRKYLYSLFWTDFADRFPRFVSIKFIFPPGTLYLNGNVAIKVSNYIRAMPYASWFMDQRQRFKNKFLKNSFWRTVNCLTKTLKHNDIYT